MTANVLIDQLTDLTAGPLGIAVSGGGDSMALLHLLAELRDPKTLFAATVDHGLRQDAAREAKMVKTVCADLSIQHQTLHWHDWDGTGNLSDAARRARYSLMGDWAHSVGVKAVALGHTADDLAETFMMRLARGAGIDGLSAMKAVRFANNVTWLRPMLALSRADLRDYLAQRGISWADDPTNEDDEYDRVRVRRALSALEPTGLTRDAISMAATNLGEARDALNFYTAEFVDKSAKVDVGDIVIQKNAWRSAPAEIRRRVLTRALNWVASAEYGPRRAPLTDAMQKVLAGQDITLHGCRILNTNSEIRICRELAAVEDKKVSVGMVWDEKWEATQSAHEHPNPQEIHIAPLGEQGLRDCANWRATGRPRAALLASPAIWNNTELIAAPHAEFANGWVINLSPNIRDFKTTIFTR